eukprot:3842942-Rhodomonas_salina.1
MCAHDTLRDHGDQADTRSLPSQVLESPEKAIPSGQTTSLLRLANAARSKVQAGDAEGAKAELLAMQAMLAQAGNEAAIAQFLLDTEPTARKMLRDVRLGAKSADALALERMISDAEEVLGGAEVGLRNLEALCQQVETKSGGTPPKWVSAMTEGGEIE